MDLENINSVLNQLADDNVLEPVLEPVDDPTVEMNFWDWADILGIVDEFVPEEPFWATIN